MSRFAIIAILIAGLLFTTSCAWLEQGVSPSSNNNRSGDKYGPDIDETTGKEMPPDYGLVRH